MAETRQLQYAIRMPDGTVKDINDAPPGRESLLANHTHAAIQGWISDAKKAYGVGDDYQPELVHRVVVTHTPDWAVGEYLTEPATDPA